MKILIQCGDHFENQNRIMTLAACLKHYGCSPVVLLYSKKKGRYFENEGIATIALEAHMRNTSVPPDTTIESVLEPGITYNDVMQPEQRRRPRVGWPGQRKRTISDIDRHYRALHSVIEAVKPEKIVVWNGFTGYVANILRLITEARKIPAAFLERGLLKNSLFIDRLGVNGASSLNELSGARVDEIVLGDAERARVEQTFGVPSSRPEASSRGRNIFFPLQVQLDTNIIMYSSYRSMRAAFFDIYETLNAPDAQFLVRPHPEELPETLPNIPRYKNVKTSSEGSLEHWLDWSDTVVTINSTVGLEALIKGKKVISLGASIYSSAGITSGLKSDLKLTPSQLHERLIKYLAHLLRSNLLLHEGAFNHYVVASQLGLDVATYRPEAVPVPQSALTDEVIIQVAVPLTATLDLTYRKNKVKIDQAWIKTIAMKHCAAKRYTIMPYQSSSRAVGAIKVVEEDKLSKADPQFLKTIDIYGNLVR
ncbi:hypothetical protein [Pseudomonas cremoricolorata]|uniref:Capsular biosynthesis protein n=1 Tax=Pseudomonas cremoricolorata TaxID=157783 RepID=A0A089YJ23_9PSED|nr:hypothetical protein [Pseudomonas cremoricolorata]AIR91638.1 hypothetical protein LK03_21325 [Pseudomonas cremoricolorata]